VRIELKRDALLIVPENDQDKAYIEDTLGLTCPGQTAEVTRVNDVSMGFSKPDSFVLRVWSDEKAREEGKEQ
jgi:hypothetical protein